MNTPMRLGVSPAIATPTGFTARGFEALFPHTGTLRTHSFWVTSQATLLCASPNHRNWGICLSLSDLQGRFGMIFKNHSYCSAKCLELSRCLKSVEENEVKNKPKMALVSVAQLVGVPSCNEGVTAQFPVRTHA